jgi:hypothetical protein
MIRGGNRRMSAASIAGYHTRLRKCPHGLVQRCGLAAFVELDRPRLDPRQIEVGERVGEHDWWVLAHRRPVQRRHHVYDVVDRGRAENRHASVNADGRQFTVDTHQLNIANGSFHAGRPITGDTGADDRLLLVYRLGGPTRRALVGATVRHAVLGARRTMMEPAFLAVSELWLDTDPPLPLDVDGEIRGHTPARITLAAQALRVMVAPGFHDT